MPMQYFRNNVYHRVFELFCGPYKFVYKLERRLYASVGTYVNPYKGTRSLEMAHFFKVTPLWTFSRPYNCSCSNEHFSILQMSCLQIIFLKNFIILFPTKLSRELSTVVHIEIITRIYTYTVQYISRDKSSSFSTPFREFEFKERFLRKKVTRRENS